MENLLPVYPVESTLAASPFLKCLNKQFLCSLRRLGGISDFESLLLVALWDRILVSSTKASKALGNKVCQSVRL